MKYLLSGVAIAAAIAITAPASAQRTGPGAAAPSGTGPGVNPPGGPGPSSPLFNLPAGSAGIPGTPQTIYPSSPAELSPVAIPGTAPPATTSAMPSEHRHARALTHRHGLKTHPQSQLTGTDASQLNQEELVRLHAGNFSNPSAPPGPELSAANPEIGPGRALRRVRASSN
jgi:hypothetical protein